MEQYRYVVCRKAVLNGNTERVSRTTIVTGLDGETLDDESLQKAVEFGRKEIEGYPNATIEVVIEEGADKVRKQVQSFQ